VLIMIDLPQPSNYAAEGYRVLWTLCDVAIAALVMFLAGLLAKRTAKTPPQPAAQPAARPQQPPGFGQAHCGVDPVECIGRHDEIERPGGCELFE
jgi:hypothetical protein